MTDHLPEIESLPYEDRVSPYDKLIFGTLDFLGTNQETIVDFLEDHQVVSRVAADSLSASRVAVGLKVMDLYDEAINSSDTNKALLATGSMLALLATDFVDGFIARNAGIADSKHGQYLDALSDVALRARIVKSIKAEEVDPNFSKSDKYLQYARAGGDALVGVTTIPDFFTGNYKTTVAGKVKVNFDAMYVVSAMIEKALLANPDREEASKVLCATKYAGLIGSTAIAWFDGVNRIKTKMAHRKSN